MSLSLYDSFSKRIKSFKPLTPGEVELYVCGVTPYDTNHLGHIFVFTAFDALVRYLQFRGYKTHYVQNITDIDAPLFRKAKELGRGWRELGDYWTNYMLEDFAALNLKGPNKLVKASNELQQMFTIIEKLLAEGFAYKSGQNIYFEVAKFPRYGNLSGFSEEVMDAKRRGEDAGNKAHDPLKKDQLDFPLWIGKTTATEEYFPKFDSPYGAGLPGWHIECTAMSTRYLGEQIDIHGGGGDLVYPHHESELAQAEAFSRKSPFVQHWMHIGMVSYQGAKMSKSLGNLISVKELLNTYTGNEIRYFLLMHHYREAWEYRAVDMAKAAEEFRKLTNDITSLGKSASNSIRNSIKLTESQLQSLNEYTDLIDNDFDLPKAFRAIQREEDPQVRAFLLEILGFKLS